MSKVRSLLVCKIVVFLRSVVVRMMSGGSARLLLLRMRRDDEAIGRSLSAGRHSG
jgi:hypothetical protein